MAKSDRLSRRGFVAACAALALPPGACARDPAASAAAPMRCADFLAGVGVNVHLGYNDSQYDDAGAVLAALRYVGLRRVRDIALSSGRPNAGHYGLLAAAGVGFCLFWGAKRTMADAIDQIAALEAAHPGAVDALEGPNEIKPDFAYAGLTGNDAAQKFMVDMRATAGANTHLRGKPLVCFTTYRNVAAECDFANDHPYPKAGHQPGELIKTVCDRNIGAGGLMPGKPMMFTEFGYHTLVGPPPRPGDWQGVDPERQAVLTVNGLFDAAAAGVARTYVYQLLDAYADRGEKPSQGKHFGLFDLNGKPKPAADAMRNLFRILGDGAANARAFAPRPVAGRLETPAPVSALTLQNAAGQTFVALWNESPVWSKEAIGPVEVTPAPVSMTLPAPAKVRVFDLIDAGGDADRGVVSQIQAPVGAHPLIVQIG